jgi:hypothetical protein
MKIKMIKHGISLLLIAKVLLKYLKMKRLKENICLDLVHFGKKLNIVIMKGRRTHYKLE